MTANRKNGPLRNLICFIISFPNLVEVVVVVVICECVCVCVCACVGVSCAHFHSPVLLLALVPGSCLNCAQDDDSIERHAFVSRFLLHGPWSDFRWTR